MVRTLLYIFDTNEDLLVILKPDGGCPYKEAPHTEQINKENYFQFWVPADHPDSEHVKQENLVAFKDEDGELRLFVIKELDEVHDDEIYREAFCQAAWIEELSDEPIEDRRLYDKTAAEALGVALENTRHSVGIVAELGINSTNFYYESVESAIRKIISTWGGEIRDRIEVTEDGEITERFIDILPRRGDDTGKRFEISKDIQSLKRTVLSYPKTALYGRGSSLESGDGYGRKITFADVVWSKANGDPVDKPAGQEWVGDPGALSQFGRLNSDGSKRHRFGFFESTEEEDPVQLLRDTWLELQVRKKPVVQYELNVVDLEEVSDHEKVRLGDTVFCIDRHFSPPVLVEARVIEVKRYRNEPHRTEVKIGNFLPANTDEQRIEEIERTVQVNREKWEHPSIEDENFPDIVPEVPANVIAKGLFKTILLNWMFESASHIASYEVYGSQVQGFTPDSSNLLFRGKTGGVIHNAETDQQWYFRVRAINTHGTPSVFSQEVTASTVRVSTIDYEELSIIDAFIMNVSADKLTAGTIDAGVIDVINLNADNIVAGIMSFDRAIGGRIRLGSAFENGVLEVWADLNGDGIPDMVGSIDSNGAYFPLVQGDRIRGDVENVWMGAASIDYYFDIVNGNDINNGLSWNGAKKNVQAFIDTLPKNLNGAIIRIRFQGAVYGGISLLGFHNGDINIVGHPNSSNQRAKTYGINRVNKCHSGTFLFQTIDFNGDSSTGGQPLFQSLSSDIAYCYDVQCYGNNLASHGFWFEASRFRLGECHVYDIGDRGVYAGKSSIGYVWNNKGTAPVAILCADGSIVTGEGSRWAGSVVRWGNSMVGSYTSDGASWVNDVWTVNYGIAAPPPPPAATEQTIQIAPSTGDNWSTSGYWTNDEVKQGNWGYGDRYGLWYVDLSAIKGKTIVSATITVYRGSGGTSAARTIHFRTHNYISRGSRPSGAPAMSGVGATGSIAVGETKTFDITSMIQNHIASGVDRAIGVHTTGSTDYMSLGTTPTVTIRYK